jgi:hypothetical protein
MTKQIRIHQLLAVEKGVATKAQATATKAYQIAQKTPLFNGMSRTWQPVDDEGPTFPNERSKVQVNVKKLLNLVSDDLGECFNLWFQRDASNMQAVADVTVDGEVIVEKAPVTFLLAMEKQLTNILTFVQSLPELDSADDWIEDTSSGLFKTPVPIQTQKTAKVVEVKVIFQPSQHAPGGVYDKIPNDRVIGHWNTIKESGAIPAERKQALIRKTQKLQSAVKMAREEANSIPVTAQADAGRSIFGYLFS